MSLFSFPISEWIRPKCRYTLKQVVFGSFHHPFQDGYKSSVKTDIVSLASPRGILEPPSAVFSVCQNRYQMLVFCWHVFWQIHKFQIHKLVIQTWSFEYKYNVQCFWLKRILNIIIQAGIFREYRNKCFWRPKCFGKGTSSVYGVADIKREGRSSDYAVSEIKWEMPFSPSVLHA